MADDAEPDTQFSPAELSKLNRVKAETERGLRDEQNPNLSDQERIFAFLSSLGPYQISQDNPKTPTPSKYPGILRTAQRELATARRKIKKIEPEGYLEGEEVNYVRQEIQGLGNLTKLKMMADSEKVTLKLVAKNKGPGFTNPQQEIKRHLDFKRNNIDLTLYLGGTPDGSIKAVHSYTKSLPISGSLQLVNTEMLFNTKGECFIRQRIKDYETGQQEHYNYEFSKNDEVIEKRAIKVIDDMARVLDQYEVQVAD